MAGTAQPSKAKSPKIHYAWVVMVALGLLMSGTIGSFTILGSLFYYPVSTELGCDLSQLTAYVTIEMVCMGLAMPLVGNLLKKVPVQHTLTVACLLEIGATAAMSFFTQVWQWYAAAVLIGLGLGATSTVTVVPTIQNWFHKKTGFAIGVVWSIQSLFVAIASPIFTTCIDSLGWRTSYLVLAAVSAVICLPCAILLIRYRPEERALRPYGVGENAPVEDDDYSTQGATYEHAVRSLPFFLCIPMVMLCQLTSCMNTIFSTYAEVVGLGAVVGGLMVTAASLCDIAFNPLAGATSDRFGPRRSMVIWTVATMVSFVILYLGSASPVASIVGAGINDAMFSICAVGYSTFALSIFGPRDFDRIFSRITSAGYLVASLGVPLMMWVYEVTGVFQNVFVLCFILDIVILVLTFAAAKAANREVRKASGK